MWSHLKTQFKNGTSGLYTKHRDNDAIAGKIAVRVGKVKLVQLYLGKQCFIFMQVANLMNFTLSFSPNVLLAKFSRSSLLQNTFCILFSTGVIMPKKTFIVQMFGICRQST